MLMHNALIDGLLQNDVRITYVNSDASVDIENKAFTHVSRRTVHVSVSRHARSEN